MNIFKKSLVAAVATGVILTSTGIGMGVAVATPGATKSVPGASNSIPNAPVGTINKTAPTSLTIHKFSKNNVGTERDNGLTSRSRTTVWRLACTTTCSVRFRSCIDRTAAAHGSN